MTPELTPQELEISAVIMRALDSIYTWVWGAPLLFFSMGIGLYLTIALKGLQFRYLPYALKLPSERQKSKEGKGISAILNL